MKEMTYSHNKSKVLVDALHGCYTAVRVCVCMCVGEGEAAHVQVIKRGHGKPVAYLNGHFLHFTLNYTYYRIYIYTSCKQSVLCPASPACTVMGEMEKGGAGGSVGGEMVWQWNILSRLLCSVWGTLSGFWAQSTGTFL